MSGPPHRILHRALGAGLATVVLCLVAAGCGGSPPVPKALTQDEWSALETAMVDITTQCQSSRVQVPTPDTAALRRDANALLRVYRIAGPDASVTTGYLHDNLRSELGVAEIDLQDCGAPQLARRLAAATENH